MLLAVLLITAVKLPSGLGKMKSKPKFTQVFSASSRINWLSAARFFLFGSRDIWFVVALPVFMYEVLHWSFMQVGSYLALWIIGYGVLQASVPSFIRRKNPDASSILIAALVLSLIPAGIALTLSTDFPISIVITFGLAVFGICFALNSALHSYLVVAWSDQERVSMNVGFYYMANAGGRLAGTILSGLLYQTQGLEGCLWWSSGFVVMATLLSIPLLSHNRPGTTVSG
jgi:MFS family permease